MRNLLVLILAVSTLIGTASATSSSDDCCNGGGCCMAQMGCCAK